MQQYKRIMIQDLENKIRQNLDDKEESLFSEFASLNKEALRRKQEKRPDIRSEYSRDADRIINTHAYSRYIDKTQVFSLVNNDHITHRVLHVQLVSKIARTIGRALRLNEDLIEAIALGHDIGHVPFGHKGEDYLSNLCNIYLHEKFLHNVQSVQFLDVLENCDLTIQVLDGILCHNGEIFKQTLKPNRNKDWSKLDKEIINLKKGEKDYPPMTMEGCVVRFSDIIAYLGRDLQDARELGLVQDLSDIPNKCKEIIGTSNKEIVNTLIIDLVENSADMDFISYSDDVFDALELYRVFNYDNIYKHPSVLIEMEKIKGMYNILFTQFLDDLENGNTNSKVYSHFIDLSWINKSYLENSSNAEKVRDYISGMTDHYFETAFKELILPKGAI
jgi:dGTPase